MSIQTKCGVLFYLKEVSSQRSLSFGAVEGSVTYTLKSKEKSKVVKNAENLDFKFKC